MMKNCRLYRWMITAWLIIGCALPAFAQTEAYSYHQGGSVNRTPELFGGSAVPSAAIGATYAPALPFRSTSTLPMSGSRLSAYDYPLDTYTSRPGRPRKSPWDDPEDDPIGVVPDPVPIGDIMPLLLLAWLFSMAVFLRRKRNCRV